MSEISIYDIVPTPKLADKLIGTSVGGTIPDVTYNFTLQELLDLFIPVLPANNLQGVLNYGNTATQNINLTGTINTTNLNVLSTANILDSNFTGKTRISAGLYDVSNSKGTAGQVLRSTGSAVEWYTVPTVIPTLQQVLQSGNTSDVSIVLTANITASTATASNVVSNSSLSVNGSLKDGTASTGGSNQILSSTGSGVRWVDMPVYTAVSPLLYNSGTKTFSIQVANSSQSGYLSSSDWINFDGKQDHILLTTTGTSGAATFVGNTLNIPVYTPDLSGYVPVSRTLTINGITYDLSANRSWIIPAGVASVTASSPLVSSGGANPDISIPVANATQDGYLSLTDWATFNNKQNALNGGTGLVKSTAGTITYITDNSTNWNTAYDNMIVSAAVTGTSTKTLTLTQQDAGAITASWTDNGLTSVGVSMPTAFTVTNSPLTSNGVIGITGAGTALQYIDGTGALQTFPSLTGFVPYTGATTNVNLGLYNLTAASLIKLGGTSAQFLKADGSVDSSAYIVLGSLSASSPLSYNSTTGGFSISQATASVNGYLSSTDWNTFNNKQVAGNYITSLTGEATGTGPGAAAVTLNNASVTGKVLTGVNISGGTVLATDTMLTAFGKLQNQINGLIGSTIYQGVWDASTNTPTLTSSVGTKGYYYIVNVAGNTNLNGITDWQIGDWAIFNGTVWNKVDNTDAVTSVNGFTGAVSLTTDNIAQGTTNLYFANSLARSAVSLTTTGSSGAATYNNTTGVFNIPNYGTALSSYLPLTGGTLTGALVINPANTGVIGLDVASNTVRLRSDSTNPFARQLTTTMNSGTLVKMQAAGYGGTYVTDLGFYTSSSSAINTTPNLYLTGGNNRVGINTDTPAYVLDVVGTAGVSGQLTLGSTITNGTYTYTLPGATGTLALVGGTGVGTVTSVAALTIGTTGTDLSSTVANSTTTPVITLNVPTASGTNRGALSSSDWITFNSKQAALNGTGFVKISGTTISYDNSTYLTTSAAASTYVPYTGAIGAVNLGAYDLTVNGIKVGKGAGSVSDNTVVGNIALNANTTGSSNTAIGYAASNANTTAGNNTSIGYFALAGTTTGGNNTAIGSGALTNNSTGTFNTGIGKDVLSSNTTGQNNVAFGPQALYSNSTANNNSAFGYQALFYNTTGANNTAIGKGAGINLTTGSNNTIIGGYFGVAGMASNVVLSDGAGNIRFQYDGTNTILGQSGIVQITGALTGTSATFSTSTNGTLGAVGSMTMGIGTSNDTVTKHSGFGFGLNTGTYYPAYIAYVNASSTGSTKGEFRFAVRDVTTDTAPSVALTIQTSGAATFASSVTATSHIVPGGTSSQFLMANGSVNSTAYLPLSGGTLTGALSGTSATFTSTITAGGRILTTASGNDTFGFQMYKSGTTTTLAGFYQNTTGDGLIAAYNSAGVQTIQLATNGVSYLNGGNVGIGTTSPVSSTGHTGLSISGSSISRLDFMVSDVRKGLIYSYGSGFSITSQGANPLILGTNDTENMRITSGGNVLIGTTTDAGYKLEVAGTSRVQGVLSVGNNSSNATIQFLTGGSTNYAGLITTNSNYDYVALNGGSTTGYDNGGQIVLIGADRYGTKTAGQVIISAGNAVNNTSFGFIDFNTSNTNRMRITSGGNVLINTTTDNGVGKLQINGAVTTTGSNATYLFQDQTTSVNWQLYANSSTGRFYNSAAGIVANIIQNTGVYVATSDINRKKDFEESNIGLNEVMQLKPTLYRMKTDSESVEKQLGFIAQDVKGIIPSAYQENDGFIGLSFNPIVAALTKAIQELKTELDTLKNK